MFLALLTADWRSSAVCTTWMSVGKTGGCRVCPRIPGLYSDGTAGGCGVMPAPALLAGGCGGAVGSAVELMCACVHLNG